MTIAGWLYGRIVPLGCMAAGRLLAVWPNCAPGLYGRMVPLGCMTAGRLLAVWPLQVGCMAELCPGLYDRWTSAG
ncbi:hypothetical protein PR003_g19781 [Phytophthora rubi]|uniref:Uncharacterized protein n=1 Tax=Phytophthora rubi TaxID=129364 RepID=A0A6A4E2E9_9STRA|nr:hypothetical protein PR002_g23180 [Phytophthora rubi]KAE9312380.1 hypothetical protein PR003_g19781 [Phytophthora rubi]